MSEEEEGKSIMLVSPEDSWHTEDSELMVGSCGCNVWISQSGLAHIRRHPEFEVVCMRCVDLGEVSTSLDTHGLLAPMGAVESVREEAKKHPPNPLLETILNATKEQE